METLNDCNRIKISSEIPSIVSLQRVVRNLKLLEIYSRENIYQEESIPAWQSLGGGKVGAKNWRNKQWSAFCSSKSRSSTLKSSQI
jgi:hypothetical protein